MIIRVAQNMKTLLRGGVTFVNNILNLTKQKVEQWRYEITKVRGSPTMLCMQLSHQMSENDFSMAIFFSQNSIEMNEIALLS